MPGLDERALESRCQYVHAFCPSLLLWFLQLQVQLTRSNHKYDYTYHRFIQKRDMTGRQYSGSYKEDFKTF